MLPQVRSSSEVYGGASLSATNRPALVGQACSQPGEFKNTYDTGCFRLMNAGERLPAHSVVSTRSWGCKFGSIQTRFVGPAFR